MKHGMILTREIKIKDGVISATGGYDPSAIRLAILYLDGICIPQSDIIGFGLSPEMEMLKGSGFLFEKSYPLTTNSFSSGADVLIKAYGDCFSDLNNTHNETWIAHQSLNTYLQRKRITDDNGECIQLLNALPMPSESFPIGDLMEFKEKRKDNLKELLLKIEDIRIKIITSENKDIAIKKGIMEIEQSIIELHKLVMETKNGWYLSNFAIDLSSQDLLDTFKSVYGEAKEIGMQSLDAFLLSAGISVASRFNVNAGYRYTAGSPNSPYLYAVDVKNRFKIK
ncbi:TPA: hypothetical protein I8637_004301 [Raoultella ornithinolytica]|uniref:DUF6236 family protein n=1 Tax=Raoultella ornithinolytica TaxID=54291 RepID=UPI001A24CC32|nr:hypothetical protein [Raoultella ornithinolytica]ELF4973409.1 hypothetical protein [Raoultella planticola]ELH1431639.1 hypothetical protein [Raoultella ornithinolytica]HAT3824107.1 hypothetical protein [Raoultella ornithinolytica]HEQ2046485.1 hypothetical protein [Raoultella ornithinolytica]